MTIALTQLISQHTKTEDEKGVPSGGKIELTVAHAQHIVLAVYKKNVSALFARGVLIRGRRVSSFLVPHPPQVSKYIGLVLYHPVPYPQYNAVPCYILKRSVVSQYRAQHSSQWWVVVVVVVVVLCMYITYPYHYYYSIKMKKEEVELTQQLKPRFC